VYASFIGECRIWLESIGRVRYAIRHDQAREPHWDRANAGRTRVFGLRAQIELLGTRPTREAALALERSMEDINEKIYDYGHDQAHPPNTVAYREEFDFCLNGFRRAASAELRVSRPGPRKR
jgi:hypothetical protein